MNGESLLNFKDLVDGHALTMGQGDPPILVAHPNYGPIGFCDPRRGFVPTKGRWASSRAILRDSNRHVVRALRKFEDAAPPAVVAALVAALMQNPMALPFILGSITNYDGIVAARGGGAYQDVWMALTASWTPVSGVWYDTWKQAWTPGSVPSVTAYTNGGTGGAVMTSASNGSWLIDPAGSNKKYVVSLGLTINSTSGASIAFLIDTLWAGSYSLTSNTTINPTTDVSVTRWSGTNAAGNRMMIVMTSTLTHTAAPTITTTYTNQGGTTGKTTISIAPATGVLVNRVIGNTVHNSATVISCNPFQPMTNGGDFGVRNLEQVQVSGGTVTVGTVDHKIVRPLIMMPFIASGSYIEQDATLNIGNMIELVNASQVCGCLGFLNFSAGTSSCYMSAFLRMIEG